MAETKALTLTEFLTARIEEDEAAARRASGGEGWYVDDGQIWRLNDPLGESADGLTGNFPIWADGAAEHIARHDPLRVLAECQAKRQLIERVGNPDWAGFSILALPYADHPNYQQEWAL